MTIETELLDAIRKYDINAAQELLSNQPLSKLSLKGRGLVDYAKINPGNLSIWSRLLSFLKLYSEQYSVWYVLAQVLAKTSVTVLDLSDNNLGKLEAHGWEELGQALAKTPVTVLDLSDNNLGKLEACGWKKLGQALASTKIKKLYLCGNKMVEFNKKQKDAWENGLGARSIEICFKPDIWIKFPSKSKVMYMAVGVVGTSIAAYTIHLLTQKQEKHEQETPKFPSKNSNNSLITQENAEKNLQESNLRSIGSIEKNDLTWIAKEIPYQPQQDNEQSLKGEVERYSFPNSTYIDKPKKAANPEKIIEYCLPRSFPNMEYCLPLSFQQTKRQTLIKEVERSTYADSTDELSLRYCPIPKPTVAWPFMLLISLLTSGLGLVILYLIARFLSYWTSSSNIKTSEILPKQSDVTTKLEHFKPPVVAESPCKEDTSFAPPNVVQKQGSVKGSQDIRKGLFRGHKRDTDVEELLKKVLPKGFELQVSLAQGDCFFDSAAQSLSCIMKEHYTAKGLRLISKDYVIALDKKPRAENWIYQRFLANAKRLSQDDSKAKEAADRDYQHYMANIGYTQEEIGRGEGLNIQQAIWGEQDIDGRILQEVLKIHFHAIEFHEIEGQLIVGHQLDGKSIEEESIDYASPDTVHIAVFNSHFVPLLPKSAAILTGNVDNPLQNKENNQFLHFKNEGISEVAASAHLDQTPALLSPIPPATQPIMVPVTLIQRNAFSTDKKLGGGACGEVYLGHWQAATVAVKRLYNQELAGEVLTEFKKEATVMANLHHPHIVKLYGICMKQDENDDDNEFALIMEYLPQSLHKVLHVAKSLDWSACWHIAWEVASGLWHLHSKNILHRDLKSENVLLDKQGQAKLCDFGLALVKQEQEQAEIGTIQYMAPECFNEPKYSNASDIYSYGVLLWELVTCEIPYKKFTSRSMIENFVQAGKRLPIPANIPGYLKTLITKCWAQAPEERPTIQAVLQALKIIKQDETIPATRTSNQNQFLHNLGWFISPQPENKQPISDICIQFK